MASYHHLLGHTKPRFESPAKVFAQLKSKLRREEMSAKEGISAGRDPLTNINSREKHGADFKSPRKRTETWTEEPKENQRFDLYRNEAQALTLSPISSPQKGFGSLYPDISNTPMREMPPEHGCTPRKGAFLESTAVSHPRSLVNRKQIHIEALPIRDLDGFNVTNRTPVKIQPVENDCVGSVFEGECAPLKSSAYVFSPMRKRLRKRTWELSGYNDVSSNTKEVSSNVMSQPQERRTSNASSEDDTQNNTCMESLGHVQGFSADPAHINNFTHEPMFPPPRSTATKRCTVLLEKYLPMSPAKMFAYMKERESKKKQLEDHNVGGSISALFNRDNSHPSRDTPPSTAHTIGETGDIPFTSVPESVAPVSRSKVESADSQSDTDPSEEAPIAAVPSQPVLLEDPLVLNSPRICIPKKNESVVKSNKWPQRTNFQSESVIYLKKWFLRRNYKGLFVEGIHREENISWNSNIIADRVSNYVLNTVSGRVYILVGKMNLDVNSTFPKWLLKKFVNGFPPNWKALYEKFLESENDTSRETERNRARRGIRAKPKSDASSINLSVKRHRQKPFIPPDSSCPPASTSSTKVSRSGRVIKPPLEYWKGGRVTLDAYMNVTIHDCYDTSICNPEVTTTVSERASQKPASVFLPRSKGRKQCESASNKEALVPLRKVKAPLRKRSRARVKPDKKPSSSPETPVETLHSPEEWSGRRTRSRQRYPDAEAVLHVDTIPQKHSKPEKSSTKTSKKQTHDNTRPSVRVRHSKQSVTASPESPTVDDNASLDQLSNDDFSIRRKSRGKGVHGKICEKSHHGNVFPSNERSQSSEESGNELRRRIRVTKSRDAAQAQAKHKQSKCTKTSQPAKPLSKVTRSSKEVKTDKRNRLIPQEQDEDEWTEAELMKLKEAVSFYPMHVTDYWAKVARIVGTRSAEECHNQHTSHGTSQTPAKRAKKPKKKKEEAPKGQVTEHPVISARVGTLKRKQQVRQFLENMPRENVDDVFSSAYMQNKRFEMPSMCPSDDHDFTLSDLEPTTPMSTRFPEVKTPQCLHITPGMMGSPNKSNDEKYVYQLQKRMKKRQFNVCKPAPSSKSYTPTPSVKRTMRRCGNTENDTFVVWEMFPGNDGAVSDSGEEMDFYFSDSD